MICEFCENEEAHNFHHLIPKTLHKKKRFKKKYTFDELQNGLNVCKLCHHTFHEFLTEKELGENYNTRSKLKKHPRIAKYLEWKKNH